MLCLESPSLHYPCSNYKGSKLWIDHTLDRWEQSGYHCEEDQKVIDSVYQELEGSVDRFYNNLEKKQSQQPVAEWTD